ncbi:hypothetical protein [Caulifigura coniformis]|nr:hypothetical protein [Caulifigura coniformis]
MSILRAIRRKCAGLAYLSPDGGWRAGPRQPIRLFHDQVPQHCGHCGGKTRIESSGTGFRVTCGHRRVTTPCVNSSTRNVIGINRALTLWIIGLLRDRSWVDGLFQTAILGLKPSLPADFDYERFRSRVLPEDFLALPDEGNPSPPPPPPGAASGEPFTAPIFQTWVKELEAVFAEEANPALRRMRSKLLERAQGSAILKRRMERMPVCSEFIRNAAALSDVIERDQLPPDRLSRIIESIVFRSAPDDRRPGGAWIAEVRLNLGQLAMLIEPRGMTAGMRGASWIDDPRTVPLDRPALSERLQQRIVDLFQGQMTQRQVADALGVSQALVAGVLDRAPPENPAATPLAERRRQIDAQHAARLVERHSRDHGFAMANDSRTERGDQARRKHIQTMVSDVLNGSEPLLHLAPPRFAAAITGCDDPDLDLPEHRPDPKRGQILDAVDEPAGMHSGMGGPRVPEDDWQVLISSPGSDPRPAPTPANLDTWAREGLQHIRRSQWPDFLRIAEPDFLLQVALDCHDRGAPIPGSVGPHALMVRDAVRALQSYDRGQIAFACPLGGALWLRGLGSVETLLTEARILAGQPSSILETALGYPAAWFDTYRVLLFSIPPAVIDVSQIAAAGLTPFESLRHLLLNVAGQGPERLERFAAALVRLGHLRGRQRFQIPCPMLGRAELANYEIFFQSCWLRPTEENARFVVRQRERLERYQHKRRLKQRDSRMTAGPGPDLDAAAAMLEATFDRKGPAQGKEKSAGASAPCQPGDSRPLKRYSS